jgi:hypothetical protein
VIGAAHRRQGKPCQDASLCCSLPAGREQQLQLMAVADGHGGSRYWLSQVGSAMACEQARLAVAELLRHTPLNAAERWRQLLQQELPAAIQSGWLQAIEADWQQRPEREQPFSPLTYGCTLGLVLLAPHWWGCTGLGDWDLAAVEEGGRARLLSQENDPDLAAGEATASLCQPVEQQRWWARAQLQPLNAGDPLRALMLSTDGVRKSCATDADYLQLCAGVAELHDPAELEQGLARITAEGSGDDVSLAIAVRNLGLPSRRPTLRLKHIPVAAAGTAALLGLSGLLSWGLLRRHRDPIAVQAQQLCERPWQIQATLSQRRSQFLAVLQTPTAATRLGEQAEEDPLGALIAASSLRPVPGCDRLRLELDRQWHLARAGKMPVPAAPPAAPSSP